MGVRRLFSRGGQNFPGEGAKTYYSICLKTPKTYYFPLKKVKKTYYFGQPGGGARSPSCPPLRTPMSGRRFLIHAGPSYDEKGLWVNLKTGVRSIKNFVNFSSKIFFLLERIFSSKDQYKVSRICLCVQKY
jgi:hypothetical protein